MPIVSVYLLQVVLVLKACRLTGTRHLLAVGCLFCLSLYGCLIGEHLVFATALVGFLPVLLNGQTTSVRDLIRSGRARVVVVPIAAVALYAVLVILTSPSGLKSQDATRVNMPLVWGNINAITLLSVTYYQLRNLDMLQPLWTSSVNVWFWRGQNWITIAIVFASLLALGVAVWSRKAFVDAMAAQASKSISGFIIWCVAGILAVSAIHMLNGGYAASSRHQYVPLVFFTLLLAGLTSWLRAGKDISSSVFLGVSIACAVSGIVSTWAVIGTNRYELRRHHALLEFLTQNPQAEPISLEFSPPLYAYWPRHGRTVSHPLDAEWVINCGLPPAGKVIIDSSSSRKIVVTESSDGRMKVSEGERPKGRGGAG